MSQQSTEKSEGQDQVSQRTYDLVLETMVETDEAENETEVPRASEAVAQNQDHSGLGLWVVP